MNKHQVAKHNSMKFKCGLDPYLQAEDPQCSVKTPDFVQRNRQKIKAALYDNRTLVPGSRKWCKHALYLGALLDRQDRQILSFHQKLASSLCHRYEEIKVELPANVSMRDRNDCSLIDWKFNQFAEILKNTAAKLGVKLTVHIDRENAA